MAFATLLHPKDRARRAALAAALGWAICSVAWAQAGGTSSGAGSNTASGAGSSVAGAASGSAPVVPIVPAAAAVAAVAIQGQGAPALSGVPASAPALFALASPNPAAPARANLPALKGHPADNLIIEAQEAQRRGDRNRLSSLRSVVVAAEHPLASWVDYWDFFNRLTFANSDEVEAFFARWRGSYAEDRLRNDWLLVLGRRRDWAGFARDVGAFRMNDDREVHCYRLLTQHLAGADVRDAARSAWYAQREMDDGCWLLANTLVEAQQLGAADIWQELRLSMEAGRVKASRAAAGLLGEEVQRAVGEILDSPARYLTRRPPAANATSRQLAALAVIRMASNDSDAAAQQLQAPWARALEPGWAAAAWAAVARQAAMRQLDDAVPWYTQSLALRARSTQAPQWNDDTLAWAVRAALRSARSEPERWSLIAAAVNAMPESEQKEPAWAYWGARAQIGRAAPEAVGEGYRAGARRQLDAIASPLHFYGKLALDDLGRSAALPTAPAPLTAAERATAAAHGGLTRALQLYALGLRSEGIREWNFSLIGMSDRELLAAAQRACEREVWDRCIFASERTRQEIDLNQRYPMPYRPEVAAATQESGLDAALVYGLMRQESRFMPGARSHVGASGLMQVMPATARWTAQRTGLDFRPEMVADRAINIRIGSAYLRRVLDDFGGSAPMAAAAYNAGPSRSRRWREGALMEPAAWAETIPFNETRGYVKQVLSNAALYGALITAGSVPSLKARLGPPIGPRELTAAAPDKELP